MDSKKHPVEDLIGQKLIKVQEDGSIGEVPIGTWLTENANIKYLCFYFGAHWAPPSRLFTSTLQEKFYSIVNKDEKSAEVVFVTDDREASHFERNFKKMPWYAVPYESKQNIGNLKSRYGVYDLPTLIVVDPSTGEVIDHDGREYVTNCTQAVARWNGIIDRKKNPEPEEAQIVS